MQQVVEGKGSMAGSERASSAAHKLFHPEPSHLTRQEHLSQAGLVEQIAASMVEMPDAEEMAIFWMEVRQNKTCASQEKELYSTPAYN